MTKVQASIDPVAMRRVARDSPRLDEVIKRKADGIRDHALAVFAARQRADNEWRTSITTPPKYASSFFVSKITQGDKYAWEVRNIDPGAQFVEFGAHAGGRTPVLGYRPLTIAMAAAGLAS